MHTTQALQSSRSNAAEPSRQVGTQQEAFNSCLKCVSIKHNGETFSYLNMPLGMPLAASIHTSIIIRITYFQAGTYSQPRRPLHYRLQQTYKRILNGTERSRWPRETEISQCLRGTLPPEKKIVSVFGDSIGLGFITICLLRRGQTFGRHPSRYTSLTPVGRLHDNRLFKALSVWIESWWLIHLFSPDLNLSLAWFKFALGVDMP